MNTAMRRAALCLTTAIGAAVATPSLAQEDATLDTVIVTARRMDERLQDVPISITVFNQDQLNKRNVTSGADLQAYTPSLTANSTLGTNSTTFALRGFATESRTTASVGVYFADVVAPRGGAGGTPVGDGAGPGAFFDLQNVQVLKGPQGTLFGRNTTGGAILLVPQKPTREFGGYVEGSVGNYDMRRLQAVVNIPLAETARLRLGMDVSTRDGYIKNVGVAGPSHLGDDNFTAYRASFVADLTPDLENYTIASYSRSYNSGPTRKITGCSNAFPFGILCQQQVARQANEGFYTVQNYMPNPRAAATQYQVINTTTWHASDNLTVKNIMSFSRIKSIMDVEVFGGHFVIPSQFGPIPNTGPFAGAVFGFAQITSPANIDTGNQENFTNELQFQGNAFDNRLTWQAGGYYEESNPVGPTGAQSPVLLYCSNRLAFQCTDIIGTLLGIPGQVSSMNYVLGEVSFKNLGIYGQGAYSLTDQLKLTVGLRYTHDVTRATARQVTYRFFQPNVPTGFCTLNISQPAPTPDACSTTTEQRSHKPTWVIDLDYKPTDDILLYGKYSRGYRQGAVNFSAPVLFQTYGPEKVDAYEVGAKTSFRSGGVRGSLNIAAFYNDFTNQQLGVSLGSSTGAVTVTQAIVNGGKSRIYGAEVDGTISPFENFRLDVGYAYLNTKLQELTPVVIPPGSAYDVVFPGAAEGSRLPYTPKHKLTATATYTIPLGEEVGEINLGATYSYTSNTFIQSGPLGTIKSVSLTNLNADWENIAGRPIDLSFFVTNVFDKAYYTGVADLRASGGFVAQPLGYPRMYGMRVKYRFGQ
jgi:iron complex outermembrane receptor protein